MKTERALWIVGIVLAVLLTLYLGHTETDTRAYDTLKKQYEDSVLSRDKTIDSLVASKFIFDSLLSVKENDLSLLRNQKALLLKRLEDEKSHNNSLSADSSIGLLFSNLPISK